MIMPGQLPVVNSQLISRLSVSARPWPTSLAASAIRLPGDRGECLRAMFWMTFDGTMNSALFTEFLDLLIHDIDGKIFLIVDNVKYHTSKETSEWVKEHGDRIELFYLPSYSPDLNPDEWVWKNVKNDHIAREVPQRPGHLFEISRRALEGFTRPRRKSGHSSRILTSPISVTPMPEIEEPPKISFRLGNRHPAQPVQPLNWEARLCGEQCSAVRNGSRAKDPTNAHDRSQSCSPTPMA